MNRPDYCDGDYGEDCDSSREVSDVETILEDQGRTELLDYMNTYWLSDDESSNDFWAHEWNTHGTCINTIEPSCYTDYTDNEEVGDFFQEVVDLFKTLDTYTVIILSFAPLSHIQCSVFCVFLVTHD